MKQRLALAFVLGVVAVAAGCDDDPATPRGDGGGGDATGGVGGDGGPGDTPMTDAPMGDGPGADRGDGSTTDTGPTNPSETVGAPGGRLVSEDGRLILELPRGALSYPVEVTITVDQSPPVGALGAVYEIAPAGLRLLRAAKVTVRYQPGEITAMLKDDDSRLGIYRDGQWSELPRSRPNTGVREVTADISQLGVVGLLPGLCRVCNTTCTAGACTFGSDPTTGTGGVAGKCAAYGNGCQRCVPACDNDGDGFCPGGTTMDQPGGDCNDGDATVYPEAVEVCGNGLDDDCDNHVDDGCTVCKSHAECTVGNQACTDGYCSVCDSAACTEANCFFGDEGATVPGRCHALGGGGCKVCVPSCDLDGDGYCPQADPGNRQMGGDCVDDDPNISPKANDICGNGADDDCNGFIDDGCSLCTEDDECPAAGQTCRKGGCQGCKMECDPALPCKIGPMPTDPEGKCVASGKGCTECVPKCDADGDGFCSQATDMGPAGDCDDTNRDIFPNAIEVCENGLDDDCDDQKDEGCKACSVDGDCNQGSQSCQEGFCEVCPANCDPTTCRFGAMMVEGMPVVEGVAGACVNYGMGCSKCVPACDKDGDGVCPEMNPGNDQPGGDCNDSDGKIAPNQPEVCGNMKDDDCDGRIDEACAACGVSSVCSANESCTTTK